MESANKSSRSVLHATGEMADRVRAFDWSSTPLGALENWSQSLRTAVEICLNSQFPMRVWWGPSLVNIYNDAYAPMLGKRHPAALGRPGREIWEEVWPRIARQIEGVMERGESTWSKREHMVVLRNGVPEETWFTFGYSPIYDEQGKIGGLLNVVIEETAEIKAEQERELIARERERLSGEIQRQARIFDTTLSSITDFAYILDQDARFVYVNQALLNLWGLTLAQAVGKDFFDLKYPDDLATKLAREVREVFETGKKLLGETRYVSPSGLDGYYEYIFSPVMGADGKVEVIAGSTRDITERKRLEVEREQLVRTLDAERFNLAAIIEQAPAFIVILKGQDHVVELANEEYYKIIARRGIIGMTIRSALPEIEGQGFFELLDQVYRTGEPFIGAEVPVMIGLGATASRRYINFIYQALRGADGGISGIFVHGFDVTDLVRSRETVEASEKRRKMALDAAELGSWHVDPATRELVCDERFRAIFGVTGEKLTYEQMVAIIHPADRVRTLEAMAPKGKESGAYAVEHRVVHADASVHWVHAKGRATFEPSKNGPILVSFDGTLADITDRKRIEHERESLLESEQAARSEVERVSRMKDEFLVTLSHEIRTPLTSILGWSQVMRKSGAPQDMAKGLDVIERNARAQAQMIDDLLDMSRIISGKVRLDVQKLELSTLVQNAVDTARPTAEAKGVKLSSVIDPLNGVAVSGDANRMQQVLWNLISNAVKFTPRGQRVQVILQRINSHLEISVADTGEGITAEFMPFVFDRFRQADASTTRKHGGLGLGLSIVKQLVELHGGTIQVQSPGPGMGATFTVSLPLTAVHAETGNDPSRRHPRALAGHHGPGHESDKTIEGLRVLVVDDEIDARELVQRILEDFGAVVTLAASVDEAVKWIESQKFDLLVSDIGMPGEDGYSLIRRVRGLGKGHGGDIPAIALTAYARADDRVKVVSAGFLLHLAKPVEPLELVTMVAAATKR